MRVTKTVDEARRLRNELVTMKQRTLARKPIVGFVPTMGNLHEGHASLIKKMREECDISIVSIYVNPTQFGDGEDLDKYPRTPEDDLKLCSALGVDIVFMPDDKIMYPQGFQTRVEVTELTKPFEGALRPTHFAGVTLVCCKLFNIVQPDKTYFGQKDYQQFRVVERMIADLNLPIEMVMCPIVREKNGLAMSSRNSYLTEQQKEEASTIYACLCAINQAFKTGEKEVAKLLEIGRKKLSNILNLQYLAIAHPLTLIERRQIAEKGDVVLIAAMLAGTHLIDNIILGSEE